MWTYETIVDWTESKRGVTGSTGKPAIEISTPPEFGGPEGYWTPEDLLTSSVAACLMTSTLFFAEKEGIHMTSYKSRAVGTMKKTPTGLAMTGVVVHIDITLNDLEQEATMRKAVALAEQTCPISRSLSCPVSLELSVSA